MASYGTRKGYATDDATQKKKYTHGDEEKYDADQLGRIDSLRSPESMRKQEYEEIQKERVEPIRSHALMPRTEEEPIESLKRVSPEIIGGLFDRLKFLEGRINELQDSMKTRDNLHKKMIDEIDKDIDEKQAMIRSISDMDEKRNLKLDISVLRREKRREYVQFWRDILELRTEMRELMEELEMESKIAAMFKKLRPIDNFSEKK